MKFKVNQGVSGQTGFSFNKKRYLFKNGIFETENKELIAYLSNLGKYSFCSAIIPIEEIKEKKVKKELKYDND